MGLAGCGASGPRPAAFPIAIGVASSEPETDADGGARFFATLRTLGMTTARLVLYRGNAPLRAGLRRALRHTGGIEVSLVLVDGPRSIRTRADASRFAVWAAGVAREFPDVHRYVVWNEPNSGRFWRAGPRRYAMLLSAVYREIKAVDPDLVVSGLGLAPRHRPIAFLRAVLRAGGRMDELSIHPYPPSDTATATAAYVFVRRVETLWHGPLNLDEIGWQALATVPGYHGRETVAATTEAAQALRYRRFLLLAVRDPQVRSVLVYRLRDDRDLAGWQAGLERVDGSPRPAFEVVRRELGSG